MLACNVYLGIIQIILISYQNALFTHLSSNFIYKNASAHNFKMQGKYHSEILSIAVRHFAGYQKEYVVFPAQIALSGTQLWQ